MPPDNLITFEFALAFLGDAAISALGSRESSLSSDEDDHTLLGAFLIPAASAAIRRYTGRDFSATAIAYDEYHDLNQWSEYLVLRHHPITAITRVTLYPYDSTACEVIDGTEYIVSRAGEIRLRPTSTASTLFPPGFQSVRVEYAAAGVVPADVQWACGRLVSAMMSAMAREPGQLTETNGDFSRTFDSTALATIAANPELRALLDRLRNGFVAQ